MQFSQGYGCLSHAVFFWPQSSEYTNIPISPQNNDKKNKKKKKNNIVGKFLLCRVNHSLHFGGIISKFFIWVPVLSGDVNPLYTEQTLPDLLEESNFNFRYVRLWGLHIPRDKWLNYFQIVETLIRCHILRCLIWVWTVCQLPLLWVSWLQWVNASHAG